MKASSSTSCGGVRNDSGIVVLAGGTSGAAHPASTPSKMAADAAIRNGGATWLVVRGERQVGRAHVLRGLRIIDGPNAEGMAEHTRNMFATVPRRCEKMYGNA